MLPVDTAALRKDLRQVVMAALLLVAHLPVDTEAAVVSDRLLLAPADRVATAADLAAEDLVVEAADLVRPAEDSHLPVDRWVRAWATTSTPRSRLF